MVLEPLLDIAGRLERHLLKLNLGLLSSPAPQAIIDKINASIRRYEGTIHYLEGHTDAMRVAQEWVS